MKIVFDIDNVILDWNLKFEKYLKVFHNVEKKEFRTYDEVAPYLIDFHKNIDQEYNFLPGMKNLVVELVNEHDIVFFTNLPSFLINKRLENLKDFCDLGLKFHFFEDHGSRIQAVLDSGADIYIDDRPGTLLAISEFKGKIFAPVYSYNASTIETLKNVTGYNDCLELDQLIRRYNESFKLNVLQN